MRKLSSRLTFYYKFIIPALVIGGFPFASIAIYFVISAQEDGDALDLLLILSCFTIIGSLVLCGSLVRIKQVHIRDDDLITSNFRKKVIIPLSSISKVSGSRLINPELVWIYLSEDTEFGRKIVFTPSTRLFPGFSIAPVVSELESLIGGAGSASLDLET